MYRLERITIYPVKSLDGLSLDEVRVLPNGALANDRRYALRDAQGRWINGKSHPAIQTLRARFTLDAAQVTLSRADNDRPQTFRLPEEGPRFVAWMAEFLGHGVLLTEDTRGGFPDDTDSPGPTIISRESHGEVGRWFDGLPVDEVRARFRANLEISGDAPFWEDRLVAAEGHVVRFAIGDVEFEGTNPCQRCPVPTRHPQTAAVTPHFARSFATRRAETLPAWAARDRFDHFYRLAVNTRLSPTSSGGIIRVGNELRLGSVVSG